MTAPSAGLTEPVIPDETPAQSPGLDSESRCPIEAGASPSDMIRSSRSNARRSSPAVENHGRSRDRGTVTAPGVCSLTRWSQNGTATPAESVRDGISGPRADNPSRSGGRREVEISHAPLPRSPSLSGLLVQSIESRYSVLSNESLCPKRRYRAVAGPLPTGLRLNSVRTIRTVMITTHKRDTLSKE